MRISAFARFAPAVLWQRLAGREPNHRVQSRADLLPYCGETLISEGGLDFPQLDGYLFSLVVMLAVAGYFLANGQLPAALLTLIANVGINLLPIFLLRHNYIRIAKLLDTTAGAVVARAVSRESAR